MQPHQTLAGINTSVGVPWAAWRGMDDTVPVPDTSMLPPTDDASTSAAATGWAERARVSVRSSPLGVVAGAFVLGALIARIARGAR